MRQIAWFVYKPTVATARHKGLADIEQSEQCSFSLEPITSAGADYADRWSLLLVDDDVMYKCCKGSSDVTFPPLFSGIA